MRRCLIAALAILAAAALASPTHAAVTAAGVAADRVFDPKLAGAGLQVRSLAQGQGSYQARIRVVDESGATVAALFSGLRSTGEVYSDSWSGLDGRGLFVAPGRYRVVFEADGNARERAIDVVRLGILAMRFFDSSDGARRVPLAYHNGGGLFSRPFPVDAVGLPWILQESALGATCLDDASGAPLPIPARYTGAAAPPRDSSGAILERGRALPVAYPQGARPRLGVLMGASAGDNGRAVPCNYPLPGIPIRALIDGQVSDELEPGAATFIDLPALEPGVRREDRSLAVRFAYFDGQSWRYVPGQMSIPIQIYVTLGAPDTDDGQAWVGAIDQVAAWSARFSQGRSDNPADLTSDVVRGFNGALGLLYEDQAGAPAYTDSPNGLHNPVVDLPALLDGQRRGRRVNCLDCAGMVSTLARHAGARVDVVIIGWDFALNWLRGIGGTRFRHDLFGGFHSFSYHAITSVNTAETIHDACLSVDADRSPDRAPFTEGLPADMSFSVYRGQLTFDRFTRVQNIGRAYPR